MHLSLGNAHLTQVLSAHFGGELASYGLGVHIAHELRGVFCDEGGDLRSSVGTRAVKAVC
jgi:hypothetical protein